MAAPNTRTWTDDVSDALTELTAAERELRNWRAHLEALQDNPAMGYALMAVRCKNTTVNALLDAAGHTQQALNHLPRENAA